MKRTQCDNNTNRGGEKKPHCGGAASKRPQQFGSWGLCRADSQPEVPGVAKNAASSQRRTPGKCQMIPRLMSDSEVDIKALLVVGPAEVRSTPVTPPQRRIYSQTEP